MPSTRTLTKLFANTAMLFWLLLALLTFYGILLSTIGWGINLIMSVVFALIATFFYVRGHALKQLFTTTTPEQTNRLLQTELLLLLGSNLLGIALLFAAASRVFGERMPIFG